MPIEAMVRSISGVALRTSLVLGAQKRHFSRPPSKNGAKHVEEHEAVRTVTVLILPRTLSACDRSCRLRWKPLGYSARSLAFLLSSRTMATSLRHLLLSVFLMISLLVQSGACGQLDKTIAGPVKYEEDMPDHWSQMALDDLQDIDAGNNGEGRPLVENSEGAWPVTLPGPDLQHNIYAQTMSDISAVTDPTPIGQIIPQQQQGGEPRPVGSYEQPINETTLGPIATTDDEHNQEKDACNLQVSLNLEFLEAEFFLNSVFGQGLEHIAPDLVEGGPLPRGAQKATLDKLTSNIILQFALQEVGHVRAIKKTLGKYFFGRPQLDISKEVFAEFIDKAFGEKLDPPFDVYANPINYFIGVYVIPYIGLTGYVGTSADILTPGYKRRIAGLLAVEAGQDAVTRDYLYERLYERVIPYTHTIADFTEKISAWRNQLSHDRILDDGLLVKKELGAEKMVEGNVISADEDSLAYGRTPEQVFSTVYNTGNASKPGGFYPLGGHGKIAQQLLKQSPALEEHPDAITIRPGRELPSKTDEIGRKKKSANVGGFIALGIAGGLVVIFFVVLQCRGIRGWLKHRGNQLVVHPIDVGGH